MVNPQHASGRAESSTPDPGKHSTTGPSDEPTLYEFLTHLVSDPAARSAFDADPQATLDQAGLGGMTATDVLQATSLVLDYAPVEVVAEYDRSLQSSVEKFAASTQHVAINHLHPAHPIEQEELSMLKPTPAQPADFGKDNDVDATLPAPAPAASNNVDIDVEQNHTDSHNLISIHDIASDNDIANGNVVGNIVGNTVGQVGDSLDLSSVTGVVDNSVTQINETATHVFDTSVDLTAGAGATVYGDVHNAGAAVYGDVTNIVDNSTNLDVLNVVNEAPVVGDITSNVTNVVGDVTSNVAGGDVTSIVANAPVVGGVVGDVTSTVANVPVAGDLVSNVAGGDITNVGGVVGDVTGVVGNVPVVGDVAGVVGGVAGNVPVVGDVVGGVAGGDVSALPVEDVTSALPVGDVVSHLPAPSDLPVVGGVAGGAVENVAHTATSALPLDLGL